MTTKELRTLLILFCLGCGLTILFGAAFSECMGFAFPLFIMLASSGFAFSLAYLLHLDRDFDE